MRKYGIGKIEAVNNSKSQALERKLRDSHLYVEDVSKPLCLYSVLN